MFKRPSETHRELTERDGWDFSLWYVISRWGRKCPQISIFNIFPEILLLVFRGPHDHRYLCHSSRLNFCLINWALCCSEPDFVCTQTNLFHPVLLGNVFPVHKGITRVDMRLSSWHLCRVCGYFHDYGMPGDIRDSALVQALYLNKYSSTCFFHSFIFEIIT